MSLYLVSHKKSNYLPYVDFILILFLQVVLEETAVLRKAKWKIFCFLSKFIAFSVSLKIYLEIL